MKILVTGANGYLGQGIVDHLLIQGHQVIATDFSTTLVNRNAVKMDGDLFALEDPYRFFGEPEVLLHLAWRDGFNHYADTHIEDIPKHFTFLQKMMASQIQRIAMMGSMHEVGFFEGCIKEDTPCYPLSFYGVAKNTLRELLELLAKQHDKMFQWLRAYYIVGHSEYGNSIFSKITKAATAGQKEFPFTTGQNQYDFLNYEAFCEQVASVAGQSKVNGMIEICSGKPEKLADRVNRFIQENDYQIQLLYGAFPDRPYDSKAVWGDFTKIQKILSAGQ